MRVQSISPRVAEFFYVHIIALQTEDSANITSYSEEDINSFYNDVHETFGKPNHYPTVMGDYNAQERRRTNLMGTVTGKLGIEVRNERGNTLVEWTASSKTNHEYHVLGESR